MILVHINYAVNLQGPHRTLACYGGLEGFAETSLHDLSTNGAKRADNMQIKIFVKN